MNSSLSKFAIVVGHWKEQYVLGVGPELVSGAKLECSLCGWGNGPEVVISYLSMYQDHLRSL